VVVAYRDLLVQMERVALHLHQGINALTLFDMLLVFCMRPLLNFIGFDIVAVFQCSLVFDVRRAALDFFNKAPMTRHFVKYTAIAERRQSLAGY